MFTQNDIKRIQKFLNYSYSDRTHIESYLKTQHTLYGDDYVTEVQGVLAEIDAIDLELSTEGSDTTNLSEIRVEGQYRVAYKDNARPPEEVKRAKLLQELTQLLGLPFKASQAKIIRS